MTAHYIIGYIDEDIDQVNLYRRKLREFWFEVIGYVFSKGMTLESLMEQVYKSNVDLLMIDFRLNESNIIHFNGDEVERHIYKYKPLFPHIIFTNKADQAEPDVDDVKIIVDKEEVMDEDDSTKITRFASLLTKSIEQYKNFIQEKKNIIEELLKKSESKALTPTEKDRLWSAQRDLRSLDTTSSNEIPEQLASKENIEAIEAARREAEAFLTSLTK